VICIDNQIIGEYEMTNMYKKRAYAESVCQSQQRNEIHQSGMDFRKSNSHIAAFKVHGFYLVHESLFDEILKEHSK